MILRPHYMDILKTYRDVPLVKILAGIRRCGKSTILEMLREDLQNCGIAPDHIISMRYTSEDFDDGMTDKDMYRGCLLYTSWIRPMSGSKPERGLGSGILRRRIRR